jgi:L-rhamnose mutarotase
MPMARFVLHSVLRAGKEEGYDRVHARVPDDLLPALQRAGVHDWSIWRSGRNLFHVVECDDFDQVMLALEHDPADQRWQPFINQYVDHFETGPAGEWPLPLVWNLRAQAGDGPR